MTLSTAHSGRANARRSLRIGTALGGAMAAAMFATPAAAQQCGAPVNGTVTCTTAGNPYSTGVTYTVATPTTVVLNDGVAITTTTPATAGVALAGTAAVTVSGPNASVTTTGAQSSGVVAPTTSGASTVNIGTVNTSGAGALGIISTAQGGGSNVRYGNVTASGANTAGVFAGDSGNGSVTVVGNNVAANGAGSTGVIASALGTGAVNVTSNGTISATGAGGRGILAESAGGAVTVTAANVSTTSAVAANAAQAGSAVRLVGASATFNGSGLQQSNGAADTVAVIATNGSATATVSNVNAGTAGANGGRALFVNATQDATANLNGTIVSSGANTAGVVVTGGRNAVVNITGPAAVTAAGGDGIVVTSGANGRTTVNNAGTVAANANGFALRTVGGATTINNGGTMTSDIQLGAGNDVFNNSGTFVAGPNADFGAGTDVFNNTGRVGYLTSTTVPTAATATTLTGLESFNNAGTIDLRNGFAGDTLTLPGTYAGTGGATLAVDVAQGASAGTSDRLIVGGAATGTTVVALNQIGTGFPAFNAGTTIVQTGAGSSAAAFDLAGGSLTQGLVRYEVVFNAANNSFQLVGGPSDAAFSTLNYLEGVRNLWLKSADVVSAQLRSRRDALWAFGGGDPAGRMWLQIHGSVDTRERGDNFTSFGQTRFVDNSFEQDYFGGQLGFDFTGGVGDRGGFAFGVTGGYINSDLSFAGGPDRIGFDVINGGVYGSFSSGNIFANVLGKYDYFWADANSPRAGFQVDEKGGVYGARGEVGIRFGSDSFFVEPAASISWTKSDFDDFTSLGTQVQFRDDDGLRGRFGGRIGGQFPAGGAIVAAYLGGNYVHEFQGEDDVTLVSGGQTLVFDNRRIRDYGEGILGLTIGQSEGISGFLEGTYSRSFNRRNGLLDQEGAGGRAGLRLKF